MLLSLLLLSPAHAEGFIGAELGGAFALSPLQPAFAPRLEGGVSLAKGCVRVGLAAAGQWPTASGSGTDDRVPDGTWTYELHQTELLLQPGVTLAPPVKDWPVTPELGLGPSVAWMKSTIDGTGGGAAFPQSTETSVRVGGFATLGARRALGPGELSLRGLFEGGSFAGAVTGKASASSVSVLAGYRLLL